MDKKFIASVDFLKTYEWRKLRQQALTKYGNECMCCGAKPSNGIYLCVDHIKPRKTHPELALDINNLQILCNECNHGKGNWSTKDWRTEFNGVSDDFIITDNWLRRYTKGGKGITKAKSKAIGVSYPPSKGWFKKIVGMKITNEQRLKFETADTEKEETKANTSKAKHLRRVESKLAEIIQQLKNLQ